MAFVGLVEIRRLLDDAITYEDDFAAERLVKEGLRIAEEREWLGEIMYFKAQKEIVAQNFPDAIRYLDLAVKYNPQDGAAYNDRALCMIELGILEGALDYFDKGIAVEPDYATVYHNKGWFLHQQGQDEEALILFGKTLALEPNRAVTYENLADTLMSLGKIPEALQAYKTALSLLKPAHIEIKRQIAERIKVIEGKL